MSDVMDVHRPFKKFDGKPVNYCLQDGIIYGWSESNIQYERVWWLTPEGDPVDDSEHVRNLLKDRPFNKEWLK